MRIGLARSIVCLVLCCAWTGCFSPKPFCDALDLQGTALHELYEAPVSFCMAKHRWPISREELLAFARETEAVKFSNERYATLTFRDLNDGSLEIHYVLATPGIGTGTVHFGPHVLNALQDVQSTIPQPGGAPNPHSPPAQGAGGR